MPEQIDTVKVESQVITSGKTQDGDLTSEAEIHALEHVADSLPAPVWIAAVIAMVERFAYEGTQSLFRMDPKYPLYPMQSTHTLI